MRTPEKRLEYLWMSIFSVFLIVSGFSSLVVFQDRPVQITAFFIVFAVSGFVYIRKKYLSWRFEVRDDYLYLEHGVFTQVKTMVPFVRIQHIDTQRNAVERIFGISRVVVYTAGSRGSDVQVKGLKPIDADQMQEKLRDLAVQSEDRDGV